MWPGLVSWARTAKLSYDPPLAGVDDFAIPQCVPGADEAVAVIRQDHAKWRNKNAAG
jgi:hypothetical protein